MKNKVLFVFVLFCSVISYGQQAYDVPKLKEISKNKCEDVFTIFSEDGKFGFKDSKGKAVIKPVFDDAHSFRKYGDAEIALVKYNGKFGLINKNATYVIEPICDLNTLDFVQIRSRYLTKIVINMKSGYIDLAGTKIIEPKYDFIENFETDKSSVLFKLNGKWGIMDDSGKHLIEPKYDKIVRTSNKSYYIVNNNGKSGLFYSNEHISKELISTIFDKIELKNSVIITYQDDKVGAFDLLGKVLIPCEYNKIILLGSTKTQSGISFIGEKDAGCTISVNEIEYQLPYCVDFVKTYNNKFVCKQHSSKVSIFEECEYISYWDSTEQLYRVISTRKGMLDWKLSSLPYVTKINGIPAVIFTTPNDRFVFTVGAATPITLDRFRETNDSFLPEWAQVGNETRHAFENVKATSLELQEYKFSTETYFDAKKMFDDNWSKCSYTSNGRDRVCLEERCPNTILSHTYYGYAEAKKYGVVKYQRYGEEDIRYKLRNINNGRTREFLQSSLSNKVFKSFNIKPDQGDGYSATIDFTGFYESEESIILIGKITEEKVTTRNINMDEQYINWITSCMNTGYYGGARDFANDYKRYVNSGGSSIIQQNLYKENSFKVAVVITDEKALPINAGSNNIRVYPDGLYYVDFSNDGKIHKYTFNGEKKCTINFPDNNTYHINDYSVFEGNIFVVGCTNSYYTGFWSPYIAIVNNNGETVSECFLEMRNHSYNKVISFTNNSIKIEMDDNRNYVDVPFSTFKSKILSFEGKSAFDGQIHGLGIKNCFGKWEIKPVITGGPKVFNEYTVYPCFEEHAHQYVVKKGNKFGKINSQGEVVVPFIFDRLLDVSEYYGFKKVYHQFYKDKEYWPIIKDGHLGYANSSKIIIPTEYYVDEVADGYIGIDSIDSEGVISVMKWDDATQTLVSMKVKISD